MAYWHAETGWLTCRHVTTGGHILTICWLGVTEILLTCWYAGNGWLGCRHRQNWLTADWPTDWKLEDRNGFRTDKTGWMTCWSWMTNLLADMLHNDNSLTRHNWNIKSCMTDLLIHWKWMTGLLTSSKLADWPADRLKTCWRGMAGTLKSGPTEMLKLDN